jgi:hypothetical protein
VTNTEPLIAGRYRLVTALAAREIGVVWTGEMLDLGLISEWGVVCCGCFV